MSRNVKYRYNYNTGSASSVAITETLRIQVDELGQKYVLTSEAIEESFPSSVSITGFTQVDSVANLTAGTYYVDHAISGNLILFESGTSISNVDVSYYGLGTSVSINTRYSFPIGYAFPIFDSITGVEIPEKGYYIKLSKDLTGTGLFNESLLTGQAYVDINQQRYYTAIINDISSPMYLQTVKLLNSVYDISSGSEIIAPTFLGSSDTANSFLANQVQGHYHNTYTVNGGGGLTSKASSGGILSINVVDSLPTVLELISDGTNGTPRTGKFTIPNTITASFYMRIK